RRVRPPPPFPPRPGGTPGGGRLGRIGVLLDCVRCDAFELPAGFVAYKRTPVFTESSIPDALRRDHATRRGVWAAIRVLEGGGLTTAAVRPPPPERTPARPGIVPSEPRHRVEPLGPVRFQVEFW